MKPPPPYESTVDHPLTTNDEILQRVGELFDKALRRQLWLLFVDELDVQLPFLLPIEGIPVRPTAPRSEAIAAILDRAGSAAGATGVIVVLERFASAEVQNADREWARLVRGAATEAGLDFRAAVIIHSAGARMLEPEDYAG